MHENLILKFDREYGVFICRPIETPNYEANNVDIYFPIIYYDAKLSKHYEQIITQVRLKLQINPGFGTTHVSLYESSGKKLFKKQDISSIDNKHEVASFIENTLNKRLAEVDDLIVASETVALIADLKRQNDKLNDEKNKVIAELNTKTEKLKKLADIIQE